MGGGAVDSKYRFQWNFPLLFSPNDPNTLYAAANVLFKSTNEGQSWEIISPDLTRNDKSKQGPSGGPLTKDNTSIEYYDTIFTVMESPVQAGTIWTGSDDGLVYITRDGGKNWTNVTPPGTPDLARVSVIDASPHKAGTAYVAIKNYLQDDRKPYIFKTDDYGKSWKKIVTGIKDNDYVHAVREDVKRPGLLYAGSEHGIYVSFDDGEQWQSLALNLPDTQVSDIVVEEHDLVIATHGRSMWVLDNIAALRQLTPEVVRTTALHLFAPDEATRRPRPVAIDYYLKNKADK